MAAMTPTLWLEVGVVALGILLCVAGLLMAYGKRPEYPTVMASVPCEDLELKPARHSQEDRQRATQRLGPFAPKRYPES